MNIAVDVISDVICPWCYIGKRRLEKAIAALESKHEVRVRWLPFQLNPTMPKEGSVAASTAPQVRKLGTFTGTRFPGSGGRKSRRHRLRVRQDGADTEHRGCP